MPSRTAGSHFALLAHRTRNLGDDIQSIAALQFLPQVDALVQRDELGAFDSPGEFSMIMNGWFMGSRSWPPAACLRPLITSFHLGNFAYKDRENPSTWLLSEPSLDYFRRFQPIGCRDMQTVQLLEANGVECYFSGCLTLTLPSKARDDGREEILLVEPAIDPGELLRGVPAKLRTKVSVIDHGAEPSYSPELRFELAAKLLDRYSQAQLVITSKLHCLFPCLAFGTPVLLIPPAHDAGRWLGYEGFCHVLPADKAERKIRIPWEHPDPNPTRHVALAAKLQTSVETFVRMRQQTPGAPRGAAGGF